MKYNEIIDNLVYVAAEYKKKENKEEEQKVETSDFNLPPFSPIKVTRYNRLLLRKTLTWITNYLVYLRRKDTTSVLFIPTTVLHNIFSNQRDCSRSRKLMEDMRIIQKKEEYSYTNKKATTYYYSYTNEQSFLSFCKDYDIECIQEIGKVEEVDTYIALVDSWKEEVDWKVKDVRISSKLHLRIPEHWTKEFTQKYIEGCIAINYPQYPDLLNSIEKHKNQEVVNRIRITITYGTGRDEKVIKKIGTRVTNSNCNMKKEDRKDYNEKYGYNLEADVKSSVPRTQYFLNTGELLEMKVDMYKRIWNSFVNRLDEDEYTKQQLLDSFSTPVREAVKSLTLPADFSDGRFCNCIYRRINQEELKEFIFTYMDKLQEAVLDICGKSFDSEIFLHESCIIQHTYESLIEQGFICWMCYDCIYAKKEGIARDYFYTEFKKQYENSCSWY